MTCTSEDFIYVKKSNNDKLVCIWAYSHLFNRTLCDINYEFFKDDSKDSKCTLHVLQCLPFITICGTTSVKGFPCKC